ncbi:hypothetical protein [Halioxenophilus sp. WMMB6]|uniref:hypothetical protein n=1 Tax=Halioxenophilus sp. WMMB6 TaxID=3073815 RepID=UPI00295E6D21|nr:hypothetical protein [Halioxenophilus sp. WMMB6]
MLKRILISLSLAVLTPLAVAQNSRQAPMAGDITLAQIIPDGHYDLLVRDFSAFAEASVQAAQKRGYYIPTNQRQQLLQQVHSRLGPNRLTERLVSRLQGYAQQSSVQSVSTWYASQEGRAVLAGIQPAYAPGAERKQQSIARALMANEHYLAWWESLAAQQPGSESWLQLREQLIFNGVAHLALVLKPNTPFAADKIQEQLAQETFQMRPSVEEQWRLRAIDSIRNLEVSSLVRYQQFTLSREHIAFLKLVDQQSRQVVAAATEELKSLIDQTVVLAPPAPEPEALEDKGF